jgi:aspartate oxidase
MLEVTDTIQAATRANNGACPAIHVIAVSHFAMANVPARESHHHADVHLTHKGAHSCERVPSCARSTGKVRAPDASAS